MGQGGILTTTQSSELAHLCGGGASSGQQLVSSSRAMFGCTTSGKPVH